MPEIIQRALVYKMAVLIAVLFSINALASSFVGAFTGVDWHTLTPTQHFVIVWVILGNWTNTLLAFFNKTLQRAEQGKTLIETGATEFIEKPKN